MVKDINSGAAGSSPSQLLEVSGNLYFVANDGVSGVELWKSDGTVTGTVMVKDINPGTANSAPPNYSWLTDINGELYFTADDGMNGIELWKLSNLVYLPLMVK
jgi:ELWxxDGT repeat protein